VILWLHTVVLVCRLVGCQDLLDDTPSKLNVRRDSSTLSPGESKTLDRRLRSRTINKHDFKSDAGGMIAAWFSGNVLVSINEVILCWDAWLSAGRQTISVEMFSHHPVYIYIDRACICLPHTQYHLHVLWTSLLQPARGGRVMTMAKRTAKSATTHHF